MAITAVDTQICEFLDEKGEKAIAHIALSALPCIRRVGDRINLSSAEGSARDMYEVLTVIHNYALDPHDPERPKAVNITFWCSPHTEHAPGAHGR